ncbi:hypothetical protein ON010_g976 [Phytophthora cinnamomi]|nr:hypothetical protein ON010_g976 [Phytophthora cinnamomi]
MFNHVQFDGTPGGPRVPEGGSRRGRRHPLPVPGRREHVRVDVQDPRRDSGQLSRCLASDEPRSPEHHEHNERRRRFVHGQALVRAVSIRDAVRTRTTRLGRIAHAQVVPVTARAPVGREGGRPSSAFRRHQVGPQYRKETENSQSSSHQWKRSIARALGELMNEDAFVQ